MYKEIINKGIELKKELLEVFFLYRDGDYAVRLFSNTLDGIDNYGCFPEDYRPVMDNHPFKNYKLLGIDNGVEIYRLTKDEYGIIEHEWFTSSMSGQDYYQGFTASVLMKKNYVVDGVALGEWLLKDSDNYIKNHPYASCTGYLEFEDMTIPQKYCASYPKFEEVK